MIFEWVVWEKEVKIFDKMLNIKYNIIKQTKHMIALRITLLTLFTLVFMSVSGQSEIKIWKTQKWNLPENRKDEIIRLEPASIETVLSDTVIWKKPSNPDTSFALVIVSPLEREFTRKKYDYNKFLKNMYEAGYTTPPMSVVVQLYIEGIERGKLLHLPMTPIQGQVYAVGPNKDGSTTSKEECDLFLKQKSRCGYRDLWIFAKKAK